MLTAPSNIKSNNRVERVYFVLQLSRYLTGLKREKLKAMVVFPFQMFTEQEDN